MEERRIPLLCDVEVVLKVVSDEGIYLTDRRIVDVICVNCYGREREIKATLENVLQLHANQSIIVVIIV